MLPGTARQCVEEPLLAAVPLSDLYHAHIDCLNRQDWVQLGHYVDDGVEHNGRLLKLSGYRDMLVKNFKDIPDLRFNIQLLICDSPRVAARLTFECSPKDEFLGLGVNGRTISFAENVFYEFKGAKIAMVWSIVDKTAIEAQLSNGWLSTTSSHSVT
jgi:predicted ester cyclase